MNEHALLWSAGLSILTGVAYMYMNKPKEKDPALNEVLFFPDCEFPCSNVTKMMARIPKSKRVCYNPSCQRLHGREGERPSSMIKFLDHLASAKHKVDLCIYIFTQMTMANLLEDLHRSGVQIRIITDAAEDEAASSQLERLYKAGISIKSNTRGTGALMHHKFAVIDDRILLSGSFNWTNKAVVSNYEAVIATSLEEIVQPFSTKFEEMWAKFSKHPK